MKVDPSIIRGEDAMRAGIASAINHDKDGMLDRFADLTQDEAAFAVALAQRVVLQILDDFRPDGMTADDYAALSHQIASGDAWAGYDAPTIRTFLEELVAGGNHTANDVDVVCLLLLCAAFLVTGFTEEDEEWEDYLQELEDRIVFPEGDGSKPRTIQPL